MSIEKTGSIVENALLQIKAIENAISENAKGILASTMKEEISELIKESIVGSKKSKRTLFEQDAPEVEEPEEVDVDDNMGDFEDEEDPEAEVSVDDVEDDEVEVDDFGAEGDNEMEMPPLDMTSASPSEILKVFKAMGDEDGIIVKKENEKAYRDQTIIIYDTENKKTIKQKSIKVPYAERIDNKWVYLNPARIIWLDQNGNEIKRK